MPPLAPVGIETGVLEIVALCVSGAAVGSHHPRVNVTSCLDCPNAVHWAQYGP